jgi:membrane protease YdiL (CAAX protease family)
MSDAIATSSSAPAPSRLRRIVAFPLSLMLIAILVFAGGSALAVFLLGQLPPHPNSPWLLANAVIVILCLLAFLWPFFRYVERAPMAIYGREGWAKELLAGFAGGALLFALMVAIVYALGGYQVTGHSGLETLWEPLAGAAIIAAFTEELFFRGILFRYFERMAGSWAALALTSILFGAAHAFNPNATWFSSFAIAVEAGILLGAVYMLTGRLWAAMGLHAAWNLTQGWVFGLPVSGGQGGIGLMNGRLTGSELLTGGEFGLEASLPAVIIATTAGVAILAVAVRRGAVVRPPWARPQVSAPAPAPPDAPAHTSPT